MSLAVCQYVLSDMNGWKYLFQSTEVFRVPTEAELHWSDEVRCRACHCAPCFGNYFRPVVCEDVFDIGEVYRCSYLPFAARPELLWSFLDLFESIGDHMCRPKVRFEQAFVQACNRAQRGEWEYAHLVYKSFGYLLPRISTTKIDFRRLSCPSFGCLVMGSVVRLVNASVRAREIGDAFLEGMLLFAFNVSSNPNVKGGVALPLPSWTIRVHTCVPMVGFVPPNVHERDWADTQGRQKSSVPYQSATRECHRIALHVNGDSERSVKHIAYSTFPWVGDERRMTVTHYRHHSNLHRMAVNRASFMSVFNIRCSFTDAGHSRQAFFTPHRGIISCAVVGCVPTMADFVLEQSRGWSPFASWIGLMNEEVDKATHIHGGVLCEHREGDESLCRRLDFPVLEQLRDNGAVQVLCTLSDRNPVLVVQQLKQALSAPTSRCAGVVGKSPMCDEMGLLLR